MRLMKLGAVLLREWRAKHAQSQAAVARRVRVHQSRVSNWEGGRGIPSFPAAKLLEIESRGRVPAEAWLEEIEDPMLPVPQWVQASRDLNTIGKKLGLEHFTLRDLRRSFCTALLASGVSRDQAWRLMRHANGRLVDQTYGQPTPEELRKLSEFGLSRHEREAEISAGKTVAEQSSPSETSDSTKIAQSPKRGARKGAK